MSTMPLTAVSHGDDHEPSRLHRMLTLLAGRMAATRERFMVRDGLSELRELDEFMLHRRQRRRDLSPAPDPQRPAPDASRRLNDTSLRFP